MSIPRIIPGIMAAAARISSKGRIFMSEVLTGSPPWTPTTITKEISDQQITKVKTEASGPSSFGGSVFDTAYTASYSDPALNLNGSLLFGMPGIVDFDVDFSYRGEPVVIYKNQWGVYEYNNYIPVDDSILSVSHPDLRVIFRFDSIALGVIENHHDGGDSPDATHFGVSLTDGVAGSAISFSANHQAGVNLPEALVTLDEPIDLTDRAICFFFRDTHRKSSNIVFGSGTMGTDVYGGRILNSSSNFVYSVHANGAQEASITLGAADDNYHSVIESVSGSTLTVYYDGVVAGTATLTDSNTSIERIGGYIPSSSGVFSRQDIDQFRVYDRAVTATEAQAIAYRRHTLITSTGMNPVFISSESPLTGSGMIASYRSATAGWTPESMSHQPDMWFDGESLITLSGSDVTAWGDIGTSSSSLSSTTGSDPLLSESVLNGNDVVSFDGIDTRLRLNTSLTHSTTSMSCFAVFRASTSSESTNIFNILTGDNNAQFRFSLAINSSGFISAGGRVPDGAAGLGCGDRSYVAGEWIMVFFELDCTGGTSTMNYNETEFDSSTHTPVTGSSTSPTSATGADGSVGSLSDSTAFHGDIATLMFFDSHLVSSSDVNKLFGWAAHRFGLQALLPLSHPYKNVSPDNASSTASYKLSSESYSTERDAIDLTGGGEVQAMGMIDSGGDRLAFKALPPAEEV